MKKWLLILALALTPALAEATFIKSSVNEDQSSGHPAHVSHFGTFKAGPTIPVIKGNFPGSTLDTVQWTETTANSASNTVADGMVQMNSGTNSAGSTKIVSNNQGRFEAGQVTVFQSGVRAGTGLANNTRIWGLMDASEAEGLYFKWNGTTFQVCARKDSTETCVSSSSFSGEDWSPTDTNTTYRIEYSAGRAIFYRANAGKKSLLHTMVNTAEPLVNDLDLGLYYENTNSGNTTAVSMYVRGASSSVWGALQRFNNAGAALISNFETEVKLGFISKYKIDTKFGRNPDIDTGEEDVWNGGDTYTGQPTSFTPETVDVFSSSTSDTSAGTGARTIRITGLKSSTSTVYETEDITLNGTTAVTSTNTWWRVNRVIVLTAGSGGENVGTITVRSTTTTANVFAVVPATYNQSQILAYTVPDNAQFLLRRVRIAIIRANGGAGSATVTIRAREPGGVYRAIRAFELQTGAAVEYTALGGDLLPEGTDIKVRVEQVSDTNTIIDGALEFTLLEE